MKKAIISIMFLGAFLVMTDSAYGAMNCPETPAPNEVLLFTEENFQGECTSYVGFNREIKHHKSKVRSVKVGSGINVVLYKLRRFRGRRASVWKLEMPIFDPQKKASNWRSVRIFKKAAPYVSVPKPCSGNKPNPEVEAAAEQVTIFTEPNFGGSCKTIDYKGRDQKPYPYSIPWNYKTKKDFWNNGTLRKRKATFNSMMVGSGVVVTVCSGMNLRGTCKDFTDTVVDLTGEGVGYNSINSFKIYTLTPKKYVQPGTPTANQVRICNTGKNSTTGCLTIGIGERSLKGMVYNQVEVGENVKAQIYPESAWYGTSTLYPGGVKQKTSKFRSIRVLASEDNLRADRFRKGIPTPTPVSVTSEPETPAVDNTPLAEDDPEKRFIMTGIGNKCLTVKGGSIDNYTPVVLSTCRNIDSQRWAFTSDGRVRGLANMCLTRLGLRGSLNLQTCASIGEQFWKVSDANEIKRAWACLTVEKLVNGSPTTAECNGRSEQRWRFAKKVKQRARHSAPGAGFKYCGNQGRRCNFPGTGTVAYGVNGRFKFRRNVRGSIACNDRTFGDPAPGYPKRCYVFVRRTRPRPPVAIANHYPPKPFNGVKYRFCANEGGQCAAVRYLRQTAFGVNGKFVYKNGKKAIRCVAASFGRDPAPGFPKRCYSVRMTFRRIPPK